MFAGQKQGRKALLVPNGGDFKNLYDVRRFDASYYRKHQGLLDEIPSEGNRHPAPLGRDITGYSRYAANLCGKDYRDYRPWRRRSREVVKEVAQTSYAPDYKSLDIEGGFLPPWGEVQINLYPEAFYAPTGYSWADEERKALYPEAFHASENRVVCTVNDIPVRAYQCGGDMYDDEDFTDDTVVIRVGKLDFELA